MSLGTISDVLTRIGGIQQQLQSLQSGALLESALGTSGAGSPTGAAGSAGGFAGQLAVAQAPTTAASAQVAGGPLPSTAPPAGPSTPAGAALGLPTGGAALAASAPASGAELSPSATAQLTAGQQQFAATLSAQTGLNPNVVSAWVLAEESGGAAQARQAAGNQSAADIIQTSLLNSLK